METDNQQQHGPDWSDYGARRLLSRNRLVYPKHRALMSLFVDTVAPMDPDISIMEVGCGDGFWLGILRELGFKNVMGSDVSDTMLDKCRAKNLTVQKMEISSVSEGGDYDLIIANDVLEHVPDVASTLVAIHAALARNGFFFLNVPVCDSLQMRYRRLVKRETKIEQLVKWDQTHIHAWSASDLAKTLNSHRFAIEWVRHLYNPFPIVGIFGEKPNKYLHHITWGGHFGDFATFLCRKA